MNTPQHDGGPAFPIPLAFSPDGTAHIAGEYFANTDGVSLRDWFAGMAMQGWLSSYAPELTHPAKVETAFDVAVDSYAMADAMLAARNQNQQNQ